MDLSKFNKVQKECITELNSNLQIIACAGSGKTRTVVGRNINIIESGLANPDEIVTITFTKKAAEELKQRIYTEFEDNFGTTVGLAEMYIGTIHSFCLNILQEVSIEYKKFEILEDVQRTLFAKKFIPREIISNVVYVDQKGNRKTPFRNFNSGHLNKLLATCDFLREELIDINGIDSGIVQFYNEYTNLLHSKCYFDYAQVQYVFLQELRSSHEMQQRISKIKYITIDEYQDTNTIQEAILQEIYKINPDIKICVVGDDDQTIYAWRGSNLNNFINFSSRYKNVKKKILAKNYRSTEGIVKLGESIAKRISDHVDKPFQCNNTFEYEPGDIIVQTDFESQTHENKFIIDAIKKIVNSELVDCNGEKTHISYDDIAILVQSTNNLREFNPELLSLLEANNIPFIVDGTKQLFEQPEIQLLFNLFLYFAENYLNFQNGQINYYNINHYEVIKKQNLDVFFEKYYNQLSDKYYEETIQEFYLQLMKVLNLFSSSNDKQMYNLAVFSDIINDYETINFSDSFDYRFNQFIKFLNYDAKTIYPEGWLSPKFEDTKCLKIMTIHSAKGLEFPVVFMPHLCKNYMFPVKGSGGYSIEGILRSSLPDAEKIYIERYKEDDDANSRLFYVALTRSKKYLFLTKAKSYLKPGRKRRNKDAPIQLEIAMSSPYTNASKQALLNKTLTYNQYTDNELKQLVFDFSTLKDIFECPRKFQYSSIFGFHSPLNIRMGFGKSIHNMLDDLHNTYMTEQVIKEVEKIVDTHLHLPLAPKGGALYRDTKKSSENILNEYIDKNSELFDYITYVEKPIDYKLNDMIFINGRVDLIINKKSNDIIIIDYKSDSNTMSPELRNKQLLIYALGYYKLTNKYPTAVSSYDLRKNSRHPQTVTPKDINEIETEINKAYDMIKSNNFPKCENSEYCKECQFKELCQ